MVTAPRAMVLAVFAMALASAAPAGAAQGCGLVKPAQLRTIFGAAVKTTRGETAADCNFLAPKTANVLLSVSPTTRARFNTIIRNEKRVSKITAVAGLGGPAFWDEPRSSQALAYGLLILHGRYEIQLSATAPIEQIGRPRQATKTQVLKLARIIARRAAR